MAARRVLIAGASIAGPMLAYWLHRCHAAHRPGTCPELRLGGQNIDVRGPGRTVITRAGLEDAVRAAGPGEQGPAFVEASGSEQARFPATTRNSRGAGGDGSTAELEISRGDLAQLLYDHTRDHVPYRFGDTITDLVDDGRQVRVTFAHGDDQDFDLVIAADGLRSTTREIAMPGRADIRYLGLCMHAEFTGAGWQADRVLEGMQQAADFYFEASARYAPRRSPAAGSDSSATRPTARLPSAEWARPSLSPAPTSSPASSAVTTITATPTTPTTPTNRSCDPSSERHRNCHPVRRASSTPARAAGFGCSTPPHAWRPPPLPEALPTGSPPPTPPFPTTQRGLPGARP